MIQKLLTESSFSLELINRESDLPQFAKFTLQLISYHNYRTLEEELHRLQYLSHVNMYWIIFENSRIGVIKISLFHFYDLGVPNDLSISDTQNLIKVIEQAMRRSFTGKVQGNILSEYLPAALNMGWVEEYSRFRMELKLNHKRNTSDYSKLKYKSSENFDIRSLSKLFLNAYSGGVDEEIGMLTSETINDSMLDIINGKYGPVQDNLSIISINRWGKVIGASLITISEGCPFVVIIGVKKKQQHSGLGRKLLSFNIDKCIEQGYDRIRLWVTKNNPAVEFYTSFGFEIITQISSIYKLRNN